MGMQTASATPPLGGPSRTPIGRRERLLAWVAPYRGDPVLAWRHRLLATLLVGLSLLASIPYAVGMIAAVRGGDLMIILVDTAVVGILVAMLVARRAPYTLRAGLLVVLPMLLGSFLLARHGFATSGFVWLFVGPIFAALLLGVRTSLWTVGLMGLLLLVIGGAMTQGWLTWSAGIPDALRGWLTTSSTLIPLSILVALSVGRIFDGLAAEAMARQAAEDEVEREHQLASIGLATSALAHDVNNLLQPMLSDLEFLRHDGRLSPEQQGQLERLIEKAARARGIMRRSLRFAQPGGSPSEVLALDEVIPETVRSLQAVVPRQVTVTLAPVPPLRVTAEPAALQQLLLQLVTQAARRAGRTGRLQVHLHEAVLQADHLAADYVGRLRVGDRVLSVMILFLDQESPDQVDLLAANCRPLLRREVETAFGGTMRPMAASADALGGTLLLRRRGSELPCLRVLLPITAEVPAPMATGEWPSAGPAGDAQRSPDAHEPSGVILVVDDEPQVLQATLRLLQRLGYPVHGVADPRTVLETIATLAEPPRVLLSDVSMPGLDGWMLADQVRAAHPELPIALMTGHMEASGTEVPAHESVDVLLAKPFTSQELGDAVTRAIRQRPRQPA